MKILVRASVVFALASACCPVFARQAGKIDYSSATAKFTPLRGNVSVLQVRFGDRIDNIGVLSGPDGYLLVDHPEAAAHTLIQKTLDEFGKRPVRFLINTHCTTTMWAGTNSKCRTRLLWPTKMSASA